MATQPFNVKITVYVISDPVDPFAFHININPERVLLDGEKTNSIQWDLTGATFQSQSDIEFATDLGKARFAVSRVSETQMVATLTDLEQADEIIFAYLLRVHLNVGGTPVTIRLDPEIDNPPPPPGGP